MERKSLATLAKEWLTFGLTMLPFLVPALYLNASNLSVFFAEFIGLVFGSSGGIMPSSLSLGDFPALVIIAIFGALFAGILDDLGTLTFGRLHRIKELDDLHNHSLFGTLGVMLVLVFFEEAVFRGFFLWVLPLWLKGGTVLYVLLLISNTIFAYLHIFNFKGSSRAVKFVPFFILSFMLAYVFLKFGFLACLFVHFFNNFLSTINFRLYAACFGKHPSSF